MSKIVVDGTEYELDKLTEEARKQLTNIQFVNEQILQKNNELQISETAKIGYTRALKRELDKIPN